MWGCFGFLLIYNDFVIVFGGGDLSELLMFFIVFDCEMGEI